MAKKYIDVMDTTFRDGFQSVFGGRVLMNDFFPAVEAAKHAGITHYEFGGGARFQSLYFYLREDAFEMMDRFRKIVGPDANLQTLARGVNTVMLDTGSKDLIDLHAKLFKKHGTTTIRNFDALNDVENLKYSGERIAYHGLKHEVTVTMMELPPGCVGAHDVAFYERTLREILDSGIPYDSICFKDASGTSSPHKVYETINMARKLVPEGTHLRLHTHETAGVSVSSYMAALEAGIDGIDMAAAPVSGGTSQPDILTMLHATKGLDFDLGGLDIDRILTYEKELQGCLSDYFMPPEATMVSPLIPFSPMPGGALTANTQMMRDNNILDRFPEVIDAMREVVEKGGYGTSVTPVSQFYFQQALNNVMQGPWNAIAPGYGKMVLGYFGKTPVSPDPEIVKIASEKLGLEPTTENALDLATADESKSLETWINKLKEEGLDITEENIFIAAACQEKGIAFLKGKGELNVRKISQMKKEEGSLNMGSGNYTVVVDGQKFSVQVAEGDADIQVTAVNGESASTATPKVSGSDISIKALLPGNVWKIVANPGQSVNEGDVIMILESMKMEIDVPAPRGGVVKSINVATNDKVVEGQVVAVIG
ncbi:MAG: biotin attachment protein [Epsilonproteobacteria bacterium]|nr:biotin attachment protein [Campylobacterota bacterium]OIO17205.1 MAG: biotin attachment protein [Helicobacteraceae bacterium CG1_02_36_14]PIP11118.1 MAG: biotin attachment protein [Sulfurimonas sp. CG23_combo_of_CG06-09_8_20_14_all_36_33]PIS24853.1 MAG: biotin attachment protein [Sulfurimonas sp. CG08_land_8_20_14_0_20_36_33]PIU34559.1 MAG: biotin attachment protein [Sulfurimonas sp. CG07_land_8_20_14_0_80_36_56]PIV04742.1 MAG: biotin attachment protein [Sulfurimonas sp. CG03_land_8_20_14_0